MVKSDIMMSGDSLVPSKKASEWLTRRQVAFDLWNGQRTIRTGDTHPGFWRELLPDGVKIESLDVLQLAHYDAQRTKEQQSIQCPPLPSHSRLPTTFTLAEWLSDISQSACR